MSTAFSFGSDSRLLCQEIGTPVVIATPAGPPSRLVWRFATAGVRLRRSVHPTAMVQASDPSRFRVLLANEQEGWHQTVRRLLEPQGVQTLSARSGREALELIESTPVHVAVLDMQMPQLGGLQVVRMMREVRKGSAPPAILLANDLNSHLLREALAMHVFSVLSKPVDFNVLLDSLARVLKRYHSSRWPGEPQ